MMYLVRKVTRGKWKADKLGDDEIPADAVSVDLRTTNNELSLWFCTDTNGQLDDAILALVAGFERADKIDVVWINQEALVDVEVRMSPGQTPVADLVDRHRDVARLDYVRLGLFAKQVAAALNKGHVKRLTKKGVRNLIAAAVTAKRLNLEDLAEKLRSDVESVI